MVSDQGPQFTTMFCRDFQQSARSHSQSVLWLPSHSDSQKESKKKPRDGTGSGFSRSHPLVQLRISTTSLPFMRKHIGFMHRCQKTRVQACCALLQSVDPLLCGVALHSGPSSPLASHTKTLRRRHFSTLTFRFTRSEMSMEMYAAPCPFCGWRTHISRAFEPLETLTGDAGKLQEYTEFIY